MTTTATLTVDDVLDSIDRLDADGKRQLAIQFLRRFDSDAVLEILGRLSEPDYEDPGPITDDEMSYASAQLALMLDEEEAVYEQARAR